MDVLFFIFGLFDFRFLIFCLFGVLIFWVLDFFYVVILGFRVCRFCFFFFLFGPNTLSLSDPISDALSDPIYDPISWQSGTRKWVRRHPWGVPGGGLGLKNQSIGPQEPNRYKAKWLKYYFSQLGCQSCERKK